MGSIYIHIPFCASKCSYCDFYSIANQALISEFLSALLIEIENRKEIFSKQNITTIYFGGGTPSLLSTNQIQIILDKIYSTYNIIENPEISLEANPEDLSLDYLNDLCKTDVNRLSIGLQSLDNKLLKLMRRRHNSEIALKSVIDAFNLGFTNISLDLIYGIAGLTNSDWRKHLETVLNLPITHLSAYHLGVEEGTLLNRKLKEGSFQIIDENTSFEHYQTLLEVSRNYGFEQYEISNFAKSGFESKHNSAYWIEAEYLGFGPSAHSYFDGKRFWNIANVKEYIDKIKNNSDTFEFEILSETDKLNEKIMLGLRTTKGLDLEIMETIFGEKPKQNLIKRLKLVNPKNYFLEEGVLRLTPVGIFVSNSIMEKLFEEE